MRTADMTVGDSRMHLIRFFIPLLLGNLFQQLYSLVDSIIVGKGIGDSALAAVGSSGTIHFFIFGFVMGLTHGFGIFFNIILDIAFVIGLHLGVAGAAWATVAAQAGSFIYCSVIILKAGLFRPDASVWKASAGNWLPMLRLGIPVAMMNSVTALGTLLLQVFVNRMGSLYVAAYSVCMKYAALFEQVGYSVGLSALTFTGQNFGARNKERIRRGNFQAAVISVFANLPIAVLEIFFARQLAGLMVTSSDVIEQCAAFMPWLGVFIFPLGWLFIFRNACQGMGNTFLPMLSGVVEVAMRLSFGWLLQRSFTGIAVAEIAAWTGACVMLWFSYRYVLKSSFL